MRKQVWLSTEGRFIKFVARDGLSDPFSPKSSHQEKHLKERPARVVANTKQQPQMYMLVRRGSAK